MRRRNKPFDNGAVIVLFIICIGLLIVLLKTVVESRDMQDSLAANNPQAEIMTDMAGREQVVPGDDPAGDKADPDAETQPAEILPESSADGAQPGIQPEVPETELPVPETYEFTASDKSYFDDALFIGDSRTVGLREYGTLDNADFFASSGLNLYTIAETKAKYGDGQEATLEEMLQQNIYGKIYVMLGINELGYNFDTTIAKYQEFIDYLFSMQPDAILYVCANLHVNSLRNQVDEVHNNAAINRINQEIAKFADQKDIFYLDVNPLFDDEEGNLAEEYISDDSHVLGVHYETWCDWYSENTIVK